VFDQRDVGRDLQVMHEQRVAVRCSVRDPAGGDDRTTTRHVFDDEILAELLAQEICDNTCRFVGGPARRVGHDDGDSTAWMLLRRSRCSKSKQAEYRECDATDSPQHDPILPFTAFDFHEAYAAGMIGNKRYGWWPPPK